MKRFVLTPRAKQDVSDIWDYIADDNIEAADRMLEALDSAMVRLAKNPGIGHWREELTDKRHRFFPVYSYLIVYRQETKPFADYPGSPRCPRRADRPWLGTGRALVTTTGQSRQLDVHCGATQHDRHGCTGL